MPRRNALETERRIHTKKNKTSRVVFYDDALKDDFAGIRKETITVDEHFPYLHRSWLWNMAAFVVYRLVMTPFAFLYSKLRFGLRIRGREKLKETRGRGVFLFGNHTLMAGDAFIPNLVTLPRRTYVVVHADNLSTKGTRNWVQMSGGIPLPTALSGMRAFLSAVEARLAAGYCVQIYPEAHVWPYCSFIRPFQSAAFRYPVRFDTPVYATTVTFQKRHFFKTPRVTVWVDGPFYPDAELPPRAREKALRDCVYEVMCERSSAYSTYTPIQYVKREEKE